MVSAVASTTPPATADGSGGNSSDAIPPHSAQQQQQQERPLASSGGAGVNAVDEQDEHDRLLDMLNSVQPPTVVRMSARDAEIVWQEVDLFVGGRSVGIGMFCGCDMKIGDRIGVGKPGRLPTRIF